ncbi:hypothetical protein [Rhodococcus sp. H29-C3]|uniref:hypothetical protein n=1 Tax=Rhodococcus sp. H29-C3 TaxID=3046307 RepID=UPI0024BB387F|nr:hypothetical protein [Rhodococcus sp. H29-C3]MDJ0362789.1 hypothetical protein [Rhodococcus sp. H29-C3]
MSVTEASEKALRDAMACLLAGKPRHTDGAFTKANLYKEAGVSRATMNRATEIMAEWDAHVAEHGRRTIGEARRDTDLDEVRKKLKDKTAQCADLRNKLDAAATVIAALHHDNQALRENLDSRNGRLGDLSTHRSERHGSPPA